MSQPCEHLKYLTEASFAPSRVPLACEECLKEGTRWVELRECQACGHVGCCDSSPARHATEHHKDSGHPIMRTFEPGENWRWCFVDHVLV